MERSTPLHDRHVQARAKMAPFAGYIMPIQYPSGVLAEHRAVREAAGLFDVSHMGEILVKGQDAKEYMQLMLTNDMNDLPVDHCHYSPMLNEHGGVVDDLIIGRLRSDLYGIVTNASNHEKDYAWLRTRCFGDVSVFDVSRGIASMALQGPAAETILRRLVDLDTPPSKAYEVSSWVSVAGAAAFICRTGYTGEDGFEIYVNHQDANKVWDELMDAGHDLGLMPCGLAARDTLRLEAALPLYGHELSDEITPIEAGLSRFVKMGKRDFIGKTALEAEGAPKRKRVGLRIMDRGIARENCAVLDCDKQIGIVTSGTQLPTMGFAGALALVDSNYAQIGTSVQVDVRGRRLAANVVKLPFYKRALSAAS